ncbi:unnamed protein product [Amaranthus hypochondriacus]
MRGGRSSRGRGGRGRGEGEKMSTITTRSSAEKNQAEKSGEGFEGQLTQGEGTEKRKIGREEELSSGSEREEDEAEYQLREEVRQIKEQLRLLQQQTQSQGPQSQNLIRNSKQDEEQREDFPALASNTTSLRGHEPILTNLLPSWKDKGVTNMEELRQKITQESLLDSNNADSTGQNSGERKDGVLNLRETAASATDMGHDNLDSTVGCGTATVSGELLVTSNVGQEEDTNQGWTPVPPGKAARRVQSRAAGHDPTASTVPADRNNRGEDGEGQTAGLGQQYGDGNPLIPSQQ